MSGIFSKPSAPAVATEVTPPEVVDTSDKVKAEENTRRKRRGVASQIKSGSDLTGIQVQKTTLGA